MTAGAYQWKNTPRRFINDDFFQAFGSRMGFLPGGISCYLMLGFTSSTAQCFHNNIISKEVCRVFVLRCQSTSHLTCLVSFHRVSPIIYSYTSYIHTFIQSYIHTLILSRIHTFMHTHHIHNINSYMVASVT